MRMAILITLAAVILTAPRPARAGEADTIPLPTGATGPAVPAGTLRPPSAAATATAATNPSALPPPLPELMLPSMGSRSVQITAQPTGSGSVPSLTTVPAGPGGVQTTRVVVAPTPLTAVARRSPATSPLPPVGSIASPLAASAVPPPAVPVTSPLVGALVSGGRDAAVPPPVQAAPMTPMTPNTTATATDAFSPMTPTTGQAPEYYSETAAVYGTGTDQSGSPPAAVRSAPADRRSGQGYRPERRERAAPRYDPLPLRFADMDQYDQIAMEPYRDRYDRLSIGEKASLYGQQFEFMRGRPPRFDPRVSIEAERFREASQATDIVAKRQSMYKPALEKPRAPRPEEQAEALLGTLPGPWEQVAAAAAPPPDEPNYHDFDADNRMENLRQGWNAMDVIRGRRQR
ncbi:MAG: hypothetical protein LUG50_01430 [Planctomycetaceae bacterium]|nr:hypothetical protein [Planctomycetaceae bacterium]